MPSKSIASILNNESNLRILEKLKGKPYYPRELAAEMKLSEPFIVRRLKAMEEHDIVEGRWETENGRRVKRYYVKDITMQLGKDGLRVTSAEASANTDEIDLKKEAIKFLLLLPLILFVFYAVNSRNMVISVAICLYWAWRLAINVALYRNYPYKHIVTASLLCVVGITFVLTTMAIQFLDINLLIDSGLVLGLLFATIGILFFIGLGYHIRFSQIEARAVAADKKELIASLDPASLPIKFFYLPMVLRWRVSEYFQLV